VLAFLPTRDGRLALRGPAGGSFTVTLVAWL
jgi:hypothetical protein